MRRQASFQISTARDDCSDSAILAVLDRSVAVGVFAQPWPTAHRLAQCSWAGPLPSLRDGHIRVPRICSGDDHSRNLRQPPGPSRETQAPPKKTACGICGLWQRSYYDRKLQVVRDLSCGNLHIYLELEVRRVDCGACGTVKRERLTWLADNPFYTKRFAFFVGRRCRAATIKDVAKELHLDWHSVKELEKQYMREQLRRAGTPAPKVIGIDEISIGRGHTYRIVVSDLLRRRPIWFGGKDNSEQSLDLFFQEWGIKKTRGIYLRS